MKLPEITKGDWTTDRRFPGTVVVAGSVAPCRDGHGHQCRSVCRVDGSALPQWKPNIEAISAVPKMMAALLFCQKYAAMQDEKGNPLPSQLVNTIRAALIAAGATE